MNSTTRKWAALAALVLIIAAFGVAYAADDTIVNETAAPPVWINPGYRFIASANTSLGKGLIVEVHDRNQGGGAGYVKYICTTAADQTGLPGGTTARFQCDSTANIIGGAASPDVEYQFAFCDYGTTNNCINYTGFSWTFNTGPTAVKLNGLAAQSSLFLPMAGAVLALGGLGAVAAWRRRK